LKSINSGNTWTVLGADVFGIAYTEPPGQFPQYNAVGKVRVDPNNSNNVVAGTKKGLYISRDAGVSWTQCATNPYSTQRQDITGLELSNISGTTRIICRGGHTRFPDRGPIRPRAEWGEWYLPCQHAAWRLSDLHFHRQQHEWLCFRNGGSGSPYTRPART
jgi:hypothetical protein